MSVSFKKKNSFLEKDFIQQKKIVEPTAAGFEPAPPKGFDDMTHEHSSQTP